MSLLVVGSIALDSIFTPFGETADTLGGSAVYFSVAGSILHPVQVVGVVGQRLSARRAGAARRRAASTGRASSRSMARAFAGKGSTPTICRAGRRWRRGSASSPISSPSCRRSSAAAEFLFLGNIDPELQLGVLSQVSRPKMVVCDTMNYWIQGKKAALLDLLSRVDVLMVNDSEARELSGDWNIHRAGKWILAPGPESRRHQAGRARGAAHRPIPHVLRSRLSARECLRSHRRRRRLCRRIHGVPGPDRRGVRRQPSARHGLRCDDGVLRGRAVRHPGVRVRSRSRMWRQRARAFRDLTHVALAEEIA